MAQFYIVNLEDGTVSKTNDSDVAGNYSGDDSFVVIDANREVVDFEGELLSIKDDDYDPDAPSSGDDD